MTKGKEDAAAADGAVAEDGDGRASCPWGPKILTGEQGLNEEFPQQDPQERQR